MGIVDLSKFKEERLPHLTGEAKCIGCQHEWIAIARVGVFSLECPSCGLDKGRLKSLCVRKAPHWECHCGNDLFHITPEGSYCPNCGEYTNHTY